MKVHVCSFLDWAFKFIQLSCKARCLLLKKKTFTLIVNKLFTWALTTSQKMTTGMTWIHIQSCICSILCFISYNKRVYRWKNACLRPAYFKHLTLGTCASETKRDEEKLITTIMNKIFILASITIRMLVAGTIWICYSPCIKFVQS